MTGGRATEEKPSSSTMEVELIKLALKHIARYWGLGQHLLGIAMFEVLCLRANCDRYHRDDNLGKPITLRIWLVEFRSSVKTATAQYRRRYKLPRHHLKL